jgi:hypothetical protein
MDRDADTYMGRDMGMYMEIDTDMSISLARTHT